MASVIYTYENPVSEKHVLNAKKVLEQGKILALATDVNWVFAVDGTHPKASELLLSVKPDHPKSQPFSLVCADISMASQYAHIDHLSYRLIKKITPGPYTFFLPPTLDSPKKLKDKRKRIGIRIPERPLLLELVRHLDRPIAISTIPFGFSNEVFGYQVEESLGNRVEMLLDLGVAISVRETTILDMTERPPSVLRLAGVSEEFFHKLGVEIHPLHDEHDQWRER